MKIWRRNSRRFSPDRSGLDGRVRMAFFLVIAALLASLAPAFGADVSAFVERVGNAFDARYPATITPQTTPPTAIISQTIKSVNRMRYFNNRIYLGMGVTTTSIKASPMDCWSLDLAQDAFVKDGMVFEELIDQLRVFNGRLYMNGRDGMGQGDFHRLDPVKGWQTFKIGPDAHYFDIMESNGVIYSNYGDGTLPILVYSTDDGATFSQLTLGTSGAGADFFEFKGKLYDTINKVAAAAVPFIFRINGAGSVTAVQQDYSTFFQNTSAQVLPKEFINLNDTLGVFIGAGSVGGNNAIFTTTDVEAPNSAVAQANPAGLPAGSSNIGLGAQTLRKYDNKIYATYNFTNVGNSTIWIALLESADGLSWTEKFRFSTGSRARSMERAPNGDFYFGSFGTATSGITETAPPGDIWRVRHEIVDAAPSLPSLPLVGLSADKLTIYESSGNNLSLRIRRAGSTTGSLTVKYSTSGTAVAGTDYTALSGTAVIPANAASVDVTIPILVNPATTGQRTLVVNLTADAAYAISTPSSMTFTISDETAGGSALPLDGLALWLKADQGVTSAGDGTVSSWADQSGRGYVASQSTTSQKPHLVTGSNGRPALQFDGNDWLNIGPINAEAYYAAVYFAPSSSIASAASSQTLVNFMSFAQGGGSGLYLGSGQDNTFSGSQLIGVYDQAVVGNAVITATGHLVEMSQTNFPFLPTNAMEFRLDGSLPANTSVGVASTYRKITPNCDAVKIGTTDGLVQFFSGTISEIVIYKRPLSVAEVAAVQSYFSHRYASANQLPVAGADVVTRNPSAGITAPVAALLANDSDPEGAAISILGVGSPQPAGASVSLNGNSVTYTPPAGNNANGSFTYQLSDGIDIVTGVVTVMVNNTAPTAGSDAVQRNSKQDAVISFGTVLANDSDADLDPLTVSAVTSPTAHGAVVTLEAGAIRYHPPTGFNGTDTFQYTISDGRGLTATAQVTVTVANAAPAAGGDFGNTAVGKSLTMTIASLLANDVDPDDDAISFTSAPSRTVNGGTLRVSVSSGQIIYIPPSGFSGSDHFQYTITDARGLSSLGTVTISVQVLNVPPTPGADMFTRQADKPISILFSQLLANDSDPDLDYPLTVVAVMGRSPAGAKILLGSSGVTYTAPGGFNGNDTFSYTIRDARGAMASATVAIKVGVSPSIAHSGGPLPESLKLKAGLGTNGVGVHATALPGAVLQIESASDFDNWEAAGLIRAGQDGVAYFEEAAEGAGRFFRVTTVKP